MAKMFYTVEEAAERLGKTQDEVTQMAKSGEIQEFRDRDTLMFKVEQIDLLAGGHDEHHDDDEEVEIIGLADSTEEEAVELKEESVLGLADSKESTGTGVSIFDADEDEASDPSEVTHIADVPAPSEFSLDSGSSGSGLLDLTREADDTSLGLDTLEEMYPEDDADMPASASGLFDSDGKADEAAAGVGAGAVIMPTVIETYDGAGSGLAIGLAIGSLICILVAAVTLMSISAGALPSIVLAMKSSYWIYVGAFGGGTILLGIIGMFIGKATG